MIYSDWIKIWLEDYVKPSAKARTHERYGQIVKVHILPYLGGVELNDITPIMLQRFTSDMLSHGNVKTGNGLSANFVNTVISVLQGSLKTAQVVGVANSFVADKIKRPRIQEKRVDCFTVQEQKIMENYVLSSKKDKLFGIVLTLYTGLRVGELLALEWDDIDLEKGLLSVNKTCHDYCDGKIHIRVIDTPKTSNSTRIIPLPKQLLPYIKKIKKRSACAYIIADGNKPAFVRSYQRTFELLLKKLGLPKKGFHSLRHTFATRALECGMDVKTLAELLGHKNASITLNRYAHSMIEHKQDMMNRLGKLL